MHEIADGNQKAYTSLYHAYSPNIFRLAMTYTRNNTAASEDLTQTVFIKVWEKRERLKEVASLEDWLFILARNTILDQMRKEARHAAHLNHLETSTAEAHATQNDTDYPLIAKEYSRILQKAIDQLPPRQREVYVLAKEQGISHTEIARRLSLATSTVHTHVKLGTRSVQAYVDRHLVECLVPLIFILPAIT
jgi:RNA polymerase sigma-70 factor (family 1)